MQIPGEVLEYIRTSYVSLEKPSGRRYTPPASAREGKTREIVAKQGKNAGYGLASTYIVAGSNYLDLYLLTPRCEIRENNRDSKIFLGYTHYNYPWDNRENRDRTDENNWYQMLGIRIYKSGRTYRISVDSYGRVGLTSGYGYRSVLTDDPKDLSDFHTRKYFLGSCKDFQKADARSNMMTDERDSYWIEQANKLTARTKEEIRKVFPDANDDDLKSMCSFAEFIAKPRALSEKAKKAKKDIGELMSDKKDEFNEILEELDPLRLLPHMFIAIYREPYIMIGRGSDPRNRAYSYDEFFLADNSRDVVYHTVNNAITPARYDDSVIILQPNTMPQWVIDSLDLLPDASRDTSTSLGKTENCIRNGVYGSAFVNAKCCLMGILRGIKIKPLIEQMKSFNLGNIATCILSGDISQRKSGEKNVFSYSKNATSLKKAFKLSIPRLTAVNKYLTTTARPSDYYWASTRKRLVSGLNSIITYVLGEDTPLSSVSDEIFESIVGWKDFFNDTYDCSRLINTIVRSVDISPLEAYKRITKMFSAVSTTEMIRTGSSYWGRTRTLRQDTVGMYADYLTMRSNAEDVDLHAYPVFPDIENIRTLHDRITEIRNRELARRQEDAIKHEQDEYEKSVYQKAVKLEYTGNNYVIVCPKKLSELTFEGQTLHHCVGTYTGSVSKGNEYILFLRKKDTPNTPWYTIDITPDKRIRQIHTKYNGNICDDKDASSIRDFLKEWAVARDINPGEITHTNGVCCALR